MADNQDGRKKKEVHVSPCGHTVSGVPVPQTLKGLGGVGTETGVTSISLFWINKTKGSDLNSDKSLTSY